MYTHIRKYLPLTTILFNKEIISSIFIRKCIAESAFEFQSHISCYRKISNMSRTKSPNLNVSRLVLQLSFLNLMNPDFKSRVKM